ncbi:hypothetical protein QWI17_11685 [Gilvimarinus sp. SDUM040013]|uniref:Uncharacterized protein n=1 Tax=Gilvimarinus gilvus TaxID=3058038 RepID=A0ABU4RW25_9GAMM|nr:hypothetical protein [Gilvimarinus sp. SDUM040013]MDO3386498.1 hypothetical protein [Gilvimarinus sp. SDUM040013]MDX6849074.1 hypothetical protein [Gilvimarinus sp. SDUM040013]
MTAKDRFNKFMQAPFAICYKQFRLGAMIFFCGMVTIYIASQSMEPSLQQELITLLGVVVVGIGFAIAMLAQARILFSRLYHFWHDRRH